jgi:hypothetical protein
MARRPTRPGRAPYASTLRGILDAVLPDVLTPLRNTDPVPPLRTTQPRATVIAPAAAYAVTRRACACGRPAQFKEIRNGVPRYRTECESCRFRRREASPTPARPIALPHAVRPRCTVPACPNAVAIMKVKRQPRDKPTWVPPGDSPIWMASPWCERHRRTNDRPVGVLMPMPLHVTTDRGRPYATGAVQWRAWRRRLRMGLGLPEFGIVSHAYTPEGDRVITVAVKGRGMRVTAWPDLIHAVAWWTAHQPLQKIILPDDIRDAWPTYASMATAWGVSPALIVWIVWELRVGRIMVRGCPVQRQPCVGRSGTPYTQPIAHILDPHSWQWSNASPDDQTQALAVKWHPRPVEHPPTTRGTRTPWRLRNRAGRPPSQSAPQR